MQTIKINISFFIVILSMFSCLFLSDTIKAELNDRLYFWKNMPKIELHLHLGGAYPIDYLHSIAEQEEFEALQEEINRISQGVPYHECFKVFNLVNTIVNTEEKVENGVASLCNALEKDGIIYAEIRTGLKNLGKGYEEYLKAVLRGIEKKKSENLQVRLLLSLQRSSSLEVTKMTISFALKYKEKGIVGIDISGNSTFGDIQSILPEIIQIKDKGLFLTLHIGESIYESGQIELLEAIRPDRIGHGVFLEAAAQNWIVSNKVPIEVCLTSSLCVQMIKEPIAHPGFQYLINKHPIVICTDDPLIFNSSLSQEYESLNQTTPLSLQDLLELSQNSIHYSFASDEEKKELNKKLIHWNHSLTEESCRNFENSL